MNLLKWLAMTLAAGTLAAAPALGADRPRQPAAGERPAEARPGAARPDAGAEARPEPAATRAAKDKPEPGLAALVLSLRKALDASRKANEDPDLATSLLSAIGEASLVSAIHGHYALAGVGQAMRTGGMASADAKVVARDMERNFKSLAASYDRLAALRKAFDPQLVEIFRNLSILCAKAEQASGALAAWAELSADGGRAKAFENALEDYRGRVKALVMTLGGG